MLSILLTFTQKVTAFAPVLNAEIGSLVDCPMSMDEHKMDCADNETPHTTDCQNDCSFMTLVSALYIIDHEYLVIQTQSKLVYQSEASISPHHFPESLYRPPFLN
jgi:hypothetical protein